MIFYSFFVVSSLLSSAPLETSVRENLFLDVAVKECPFVGRKEISKEFLFGLLQIEKDAGIPEKYRGMVLAAACSESGYNSRAVGDGGKALGILQLWPWWEKRYGVDRTDAYAAARVWVRQIMRALPRAKRLCKRKSFVSAWAWVASGPKKWRCRAPRHYGRLKRWNRAVRKLMRTESR